MVWYQLNRLGFSHVYVSMQDGNSTEDLHRLAETVRKTLDSHKGLGDRFTVAEVRFPGLIDWGAGKVGGFLR